MVPLRIELRTSALLAQRSNRLSYGTCMNFKDLMSFLYNCSKGRRIKCKYKYSIFIARIVIKIETDIRSD